MTTIGYFYLMRPGEHTSPTAETKPFRLQDVQLMIGAHRYAADIIPLDLLDQSTFALYEFTDQKNGVRGEVVGHGRSGHARFCPVQASVERVRHLRLHNAPRDTPLCAYYVDGTPNFVTSADITTTLRASVNILGTDSLGFLSSEVSARSLRAAGAMALLCAHVDSDTIRLLGRWRSDEMLRYLHVQAQPVMSQFAQKMLAGGRYSFFPSTAVPTAPLP
jgi:hypothetical protein